MKGHVARWMEISARGMGMVSRTALCRHAFAIALLYCLHRADAQLGVPTGNLCATLGNCNGHGRCNTATKTCECYEGYGASTDVAAYHAPDCSLRVCPAGPSWGTVATSATSAHPLAECSHAGLCDRASGQCRCFSGYEGEACQRAACPNACSGHGKCLSMKEMAVRLDAFPLSLVASYKGAEESATWDQDRLFGCVCDSTWEVGLAAGQRQSSQWFGYDCSQMRCPSGDDPLTTTVDETNCNGKVADGGFGTGAVGNLCHVDCANQGRCDYSNGVCACYDGFYGSNCASQSPIK